jgi:hypothetical protein
MGFTIPPGSIDAALALGVSFVDRFFQEKARKKEDLVSVGLAVGYFYNFLEPLKNVLANDAFKLYKPEDKKDVTKDSPRTDYNIDDVDVQIILPKRLDVEAIAVCETEFKRSNRGFFYLPQNNRFYGINYIESTVNNRACLSIIDFARPSLAAKRFYEEILGIQTDEDQRWASAQYAELAAFKHSLVKLQKRGFGVLVNKIHFREIG